MIAGIGDGEAGEQPAVQLQAAGPHAGAGEEGPRDAAGPGQHKFSKNENKTKSCKLMFTRCLKLFFGKCGWLFFLLGQNP